jgi:hypothetical protein
MPTKLKPGSKVIPFGKKGYVAFSPAMVKLASYVADNILRGGFTKEELARIEAGEVDLNETPLVESAVNTRKFTQIAQFLPRLLKAVRTQAPGEIDPDDMGRAAAVIYKQLSELPAEEFKHISRLTTHFDPDKIGFYQTGTRKVSIDPANSWIFSKLQGANVPRHEMAHARQFAERSDLLTFENATRKSKALGPGVDYWNQPIEIHARAVEHSRKPFEKAYRHTENFMTSRYRSFVEQRNVQLKHFTNLSTGERIRALSKMVKEEFVPSLANDVAELIKSGVLSAGGATAGVQILNKGSD